MKAGRSSGEAAGTDAWRGEAWTRAVLDAALDAIVTIDRRGEIVDANPATCRLFGYGEGELLGRNVGILMPSPEREQHDDYIRRFLATGEPRVIGAGRLITGCRKDGSTFPAELALGEIDGLGMFCGILRDISGRRGIEQAVLAAVTEERRRTAQDLHDDLGALLTLALLRLGAHVRALDSAEGRCREDAEAIRSLVKQALVRTRALARGLDPVGGEPDDLMAGLRELAARVAEIEAVDCRFDCPAPVEVNEPVTANQLYRIAQEAVTNAVRHSGGADIRIRLEADGDELALRIRDDGRGIVAGPDRPGGSGLDIMRFRAHAIGAHLTVGSGAHGGTEVVCRVPRPG